MEWLLPRWCVSVDFQREQQAKSSVVRLGNKETARGVETERLFRVQPCAE